MNIVNFLQELSAKGIGLALAGDQLQLDAPRSALTNGVVPKIRAHKEEILQWLQLRQSGISPLSHGQKALWYLYQLAPDSAAYNIVYSARLQPDTNLARLQSAAQALLDRHPILRTTYQLQAGEPVQKVHQRMAVNWCVETTAIDDVSDWIAREGDLPFDLAHASPIRFAALPHPDGAVFVLTVHHIAADFVSLQLLINELEALYCGNDLPTIPLSFVDYVRWETDQLAEYGTAQLAFWRDQLRDAPALLELPTDRPRPPMQTFEGATHTFTLSQTLTDQLKQTARQSGVTPYVLLLTAFQTLLHRYAGAEEVVIGSPMESRELDGTGNTVGYFANPVVLRANFADDPTFAELLARNRQTVLDALKNRTYPFAELVKQLRPQRDPSYSPIFQAMFLWDQTRGEKGTSALYAESLEAGQRGADFDLNLTIVDEGEALQGLLQYNTALFDGATAERMATHLQTLLSEIVNDAGRSVAQLPLLDSAETAQLLTTWNDTATDYPLDIPFVQLFATQAERTPIKTAAVCGDETVSYDQLNRRANQLAHWLIGQGVAAETLVGVQLHRSLDMLIALIAIGKAGGAYVPLDPSFPADRLAFMRDDAGLLLTLTDDNWPDVASCSDENPNVSLAADNLAYVIYTSGSTGRPKGVQLEQRNLTNFLLAMRDGVGISTDDTLLAVTTISFDIAGLELYLPLLVGGTVVIADKTQSGDGAWLAQRLDTGDITAMQATPATWRMLLAAGWGGNSSLKALCGGEALPSDLAQALLPRCGELWNVYGPTETTIWSTAVRVTPQLAERNIVTIGRPIANTQLYILDPHHQPVPVGIAGELYIGGAGVARGYLNRPELTAERFVSKDELGRMKDEEDRSFILHPSSFILDNILYKTGDLCRYLPNGNIEFFGRTDHQVKLRGFRIELGEIEAVLTQHEAIQHAAVILRNDRLIAYVIAENVTDSELRAYLAAQLPDYMLPSAYVRLDALPLTPNGKVNRRALPEPSFVLASADYVAPRTPLESRLAAIWQTVLDAERIGIHDDFFALGGHSLLATQLVATLSERLQFDLRLRDLLANPTVAQLAGWLDAAERPAKTALPPIVNEPDRRFEPFPLTEIQQAYWIGRGDGVAFGQVGSHGYLEMICRGRDATRFEAAWNKMITRHEMLRAIVQSDGNQVILESVPPFRFKSVDVMGESAESAQATLQTIRDEMSHQVLAADRWPLYDIRVTHLAPDCFHLHLSFDLLIMDFGSILILTREWLAVYDDLDYELPPLAVSFRDYVQTLQQIAQSDIYLEAARYWQARELPPAPDLPTIPTNRTAASTFKRREARLAPQRWTALQMRARRAGLTPSALLMTAYADILGAWSKSNHFTIDLTLFNRLPVHAQVNDIVGDFTSVVLLEVDNRPADSFVERAKRLQAQLWRDLEHRHYSGVSVMRDMAQRAGRIQLMPVVFTSGLGMGDATFINRFGELVDGVSQTPQVWLDHQVLELDGELLFNWDSAESIFPAGLLDDMFAAYCELLGRLATSDDAWQTTRRDLLPTRQRVQRAAVNDTSVPVSDQLMHTLFTDNLEKYADNIAVIGGDCTLTYRDLYLRANHIAHQLRQMGAKPNQMVAVVMEKGWEQVVATMGILMSGAAYLPIDPQLPDERRQYLMEQGGTTIGLTQSWLDESLTWPREMRRLTIDTQAVIETPPLDVVQTVDDIAYIIYTSGSTGLPKGVVIDHRGAVNTILDINRRFDVTDKDSVLALSALNFDLSVWDIFGLLAVGGTIVMPDPAGRRDPAHWISLMEQYGVTLWNTVPALMQMLVEYLSVRPNLTPPTLRLVMMSGDWIPVDLPDRIKQMWHGIDVFSLGGATEASIWSIYYPIEDVDPEWSSIPYGRPMDNQTFHVLNDQMEPCPTWVPGQLYIGGIGVALEYWRNPEKTASSFIIHPHTGDRLYRTGDLGRYLPDGNIEFLGREDFQVKVRGHRIELGEIEANLLQHEAVREVVVTAHGERSQKQLVAYVVCETESAEPSRALRDDADVRIALSEPADPATGLTLSRTFSAEPPTFEQISLLLSTLRQPAAYPSLESRYPVQAYLYLKPDTIAGVEGGFYYYHPVEHELLYVGAGNMETLHDHKEWSLLERGTFALYLVGALDAIRPKVGNAARDLCLIEAGHIGQLLLTAAQTQNLALTPLHLFDATPLTAQIGLNGSHAALYSFIGGSQPDQPADSSLETQLRHHLTNKLPNYMIPSAFVLLDTLPLTANGKINRRALPDPTALLEGRELVDEEQSELEVQIIGIWRDLLGTTASVRDNFFELGGDSLLATRFVSQLRTLFGLDYPLDQFFETPIVRTVASYIETIQWATEADDWIDEDEEELVF